MASQPPPGEGEMGDKLTPEVARLLDRTLSEDPGVVLGASAELDRLFADPSLPRSLLFLTRGTQPEGHNLRYSAAMHLKNLVRRHIGNTFIPVPVDVNFRTMLFDELFLCDESIFDFFLESFRYMFLNDSVNKDAWPDLLPSLRTRVLDSTLITLLAPSPWDRVSLLRVLRVLCTVCKPYEDKKPLAPWLPKGPVPDHLNFISDKILVPLLHNFCRLSEKALSLQGGTEFEKILLLICKCMCYIVSSYMPSALTGTLPYFCWDVLHILESYLDIATIRGNTQLQLKILKGCLIFLCLMVNNHKSYVEILLPNIKTFASKITLNCPDLTKTNSGWIHIYSLGFELRSLFTEPCQGIQSFSNGSNHPEDLRVLKRVNSRYLPTEILTAILTFLPVKSVTRFKSLCKSVFALISSPQFMEEYERVHSKPRLLTLRTCDSDANTLYASTYDTDCPTLLNTFSLRVPGFFCLPDLEMIRVQSSGGLVCVTSDFFFDHSIVLLQPSTQEAMFLPSFELRLNPAEVNTNTVGFGYGSSSGQFRVARFICSQSTLLTMVFTVGKSNWRQARCGPPFMCAPGCAPFLNGKLHLLPNPPYYDPYIPAFDLDLETYSRVELPQQFRSSDDNDCPLSLTTLGGDLCLYLETGTRDRFFELIRLRNYETGEWVRHCKIELFPLMEASGLTICHRSSSVVGEDGGLLMSVAGKRLCNYDVLKRSFRWMLGNAFPASLYKDSMISMKNGQPMIPDSKTPKIILCGNKRAEAVDPEKAVNSLKYGEGPSTLQKSEQTNQDDVVVEMNMLRSQVRQLRSELFQYRQTSELVVLRDKICKLEKENAKLNDKICKLEKENAKLQ